MSHQSLLALAALAACSDARAVEQPPKREATAPRPPARAPELAWKEGTLKVGAPVDDIARLTASVTTGTLTEPFRLHLDWYKFPYDSTVSYGEHRVDTEHGSGRLEIALPDPASISIIDQKIVPSTTPLVITLRGHEPARTQLPPLYSIHAVATVLGHVIDRPLVLRDEPPDDKLDTVAIVGPSSSFSVIGKGTTLGQVDWVAIVTSQDTGVKKRCSGYYGAYPSVELSLYETRIEINDRRTGALVVETTLEPSKGCPGSVFVTNGKAAHAPDSAAVPAWVRGQLARRTKVSRRR